VKKKILELEQQLRDARQTARTAIGAMESSARIFEIMRATRWMRELDPESTGPAAVCGCETKHLNRLAGELADRLGAA